MPDVRTRSTRRLLLALGVASLAGALALPATAAPGGPPRPTPPGKPAPAGSAVDVQLLAFNDFHGHLEPSNGPDGLVGTTPAGGSEYLASHLAALRTGKKNSFTVAAGDLIGGSPFLSGLFRDEPSVESLNALGLDVSSVGNHEFDRGVDELLRMQQGGCHPVDGCYFPRDPYEGADFPWLAANVTEDATGDTVLPPYEIKNVRGGKIAFIGMTLEGTPQLVAQAGIEGYSFADEADTANALVPELERRGVNAIVVLLHEGGSQLPDSPIDGCNGISGPVVEIQNRLDPAIDVVVTGHTHQPYNCVLSDPAGKDRRVTSTFSFGRVISEINFSYDRRSRDIDRSSVTAVNHLVDRTVTPDPAQTAVITKWKPLSAVLGNERVGTIGASILRATGTEDRGTESSLGNLVADAQLAATTANGAQIALMNPGGLRADLPFASSPSGEGDGVVTYRESYDVQPFGNLLSTIPMTGEQIVRVLEQQCQAARHLQLSTSAGFTYDQSRTPGRGCTGITISNPRLNGVPLVPTATYQVTVNNFLADGGDSLTVFREVPASTRVGAGVDLDALNAYLGANSPVAPPATDRVNELPAP